MLHAYDIKKMCCLDGLKIRNSLASCYAPVPTRLVYLPVTYELLTEEKKVVVKSSKLVKIFPSAGDAISISKCQNSRYNMIRLHHINVLSLPHDTIN